MKHNPIKLSFVTERVILNDKQHNIIYYVNCGLRYSVLKNLFKSCGFSSIPEFVTEALRKHGFIRDNKRQMYVCSFIGNARCRAEDTFDEQKGIKIAENRAKIRAYKYTYRMLDRISKTLAKCSVGLSETILDMRGKMSTKEQYLEKLKTSE